MDTRLISRLGALLLVTFGLASPALAQSNAMLVLDGSGSMWGQVEGRSKIAIARDVVHDLLKNMPQEVHLGLAAYGHRRKGDCGDVEILVPPSANSRSAIGAAVAQLQPRGKTPLATAVVKAAQAMNHETRPATVILVSDGVETCAPDVCAVARELERSGADFTAHVIGFDIADDAAHAQFTCMADATGGRYTSVNTAVDLGAALAKTAALTRHGAIAAAQPSALQTANISGAIYYGAERKENGQYQNVAAHWQITDENGAMVLSGFQRSGGQIVLVPGTYQIKATDPDSGHSEVRNLTIRDGGTLQIMLHFPPL